MKLWDKLVWGVSSVMLEVGAGHTPDAKSFSLQGKGTIVRVSWW
jgi:hypothetical protein